MLPTGNCVYHAALLAPCTCMAQLYDPYMWGCRIQHMTLANQHAHPRLPQVTCKRQPSQSYVASSPIVVQSAFLASAQKVLMGEPVQRNLIRRVWMHCLILSAPCNNNGHAEEAAYSSIAYRSVLAALRTAWCSPGPYGNVLEVTVQWGSTR